MKVLLFRDPVHGFIEVTDLEKAIIDSPPFQRLRNIRQLANTYLVYHGAEHTRFGHSLGVMHLVTRSFDSIIQKHPLLFDTNKIKWYRQILRLIALTHDLGHAPFSHVSEDLFPTGLEHESYTKKIIFETCIADYIKNIGNCFVKKLGTDYNIDPELIWMIYEGKAITDRRFIHPDFAFLRSLMDGEIDCDKMDYLLRDSLYCGVSYGTYDLNRFISCLTIYKNDQTKELSLAVERGGLQALEEFILARYFMFIQVYFHKTRRYFDRVLIECLKAILPDSKYPMEILEYLKWDDVRVLNTIANLVGNKEANKWLIKYNTRKTMTCIFDTSAHAIDAENESFIMAKNYLKQHIPQELMLEDYADKQVHNLIPQLRQPYDDSGAGIKIIVKDSDEPHDIKRESLLLKSFTEPIVIKRIYVEKEVEQQAINLLKSLRGDEINEK